MELLLVLLALVAFDVVAAVWGVDSRPTDAHRATRWFAGFPRD